MVFRDVFQEKSAFSVRIELANCTFPILNYFLNVLFWPILVPSSRLYTMFVRFFKRMILRTMLSTLSLKGFFGYREMYVEGDTFRAIYICIYIYNHTVLSSPSCCWLVLNAEENNLERYNLPIKV